MPRGSVSNNVALCFITLIFFFNVTVDKHEFWLLIFMDNAKNHSM